MKYVSAGFAVLAAIAALVPTFQETPSVPTTMFMGVSNAGVPALIGRLRTQGRWNLLAAILALISAALQFFG